MVVVIDYLDLKKHISGTCDPYINEFYCNVFPKFQFSQLQAWAQRICTDHNVGKKETQSVLTTRSVIKRFIRISTFQNKIKFTINSGEKH